MARSKDRNIESLDPNGAYSVRQVANYVGWHPDHLRQLIREGRVKAYRPNGYEWRIKGSEVARISQRLEHEGRLPSAPSPVDQGQVLE
ncbi:MAG: excisionase family DNA-binding protein, partial [Anaerolineae bacterium]|nr:excisionase family DNA-binding protein [Anaerolineae bacterium]